MSKTASTDGLEVGRPTVARPADDGPVLGSLSAMWAPRWVGWVVPILALAIVGVSTLTQPYGPTRNLVNEIVAMAVAVITVVGWRLADFSPAVRRRLVNVLPFASAVMALTSGVAALSNNGGPFSLFTSIATITVASAYSFPIACAVTAFGALGVLSVGLAYDVGAWGTFGFPLIMVFGMALGRVLRGYRLHAERSEALISNMEQLRHEQQRSAALEERNRIAREIHDLLAHSLGSLGVQIQAAQAVLTDQRDIERALELLGQARRAAVDGLNETRRAVHALHADTPALTEGLADITTKHGRAHGTLTSFEIAGESRSLSPDAALALTRTAQEALTNAAKHAPHQPITVRLDYADDSTTLGVANRLGAEAAGRPGPDALNGGYGLAGLRERLLLIDGSLCAGAEGGDWVVTARVPR